MKRIFVLSVAFLAAGCIDAPGQASAPFDAGTSVPDGGPGGDAMSSSDSGARVDLAMPHDAATPPEDATSMRDGGMRGRDTGTDTAAPFDMSRTDMGQPTQRLVESIHLRSVSMMGAVTGMSSLPTTVAVEHAVPFVSLRTTGVTVSDTAVTVGLMPGAIGCQRKGDGGDVAVIASVVEFNPAKVRVQRGNFGGLVTQMLTESVDPARTFVLHSYSVDVADDGRVDAFVAAELGETGVTFTSQGSSAVSGNFWVAESLQNDFSVRHAQGQMASGAMETSIPIEPVEPKRSFLIYSTTVEEPNMKADKGHVSCALSDTTTVTCRRENGDKTIGQIQVQVVELAQGTVQQGTGLLPGGTLYVDATVPTPVDPQRSTAWCGVTGAHGAYRSTEDNDGLARSAYATCEFENGGAAVHIQRGEGSMDDLTGTWSVIEWP